MMAARPAASALDLLAKEQGVDPRFLAGMKGGK